MPNESVKVLAVKPVLGLKSYIIKCKNQSSCTSFFFFFLTFSLILCHFLFWSVLILSDLDKGLHD